MKRSLTKNQIIRFKADIDNLFKAGKRYSLSCFKLYVVTNNFGYSRMIVIPAKHYGNSVQRNLIRRQVKEIWRLNQEKIKKGLDMAIVVYPGKELAYEEKEHTLFNLFEKGNALEV